MGNYEFVERPNTTNYKNLNLRLYCKNSHIKILETLADEFFFLTNEGIKFYEKLFLTEFSFNKYDIIFCPELIFLGMENPGAVWYYIYIKISKIIKKICIYS